VKILFKDLAKRFVKKTEREVAEGRLWAEQDVLFFTSQLEKIYCNCCQEFSLDSFL
jgi:hypothetical protein